MKPNISPTCLKVLEAIMQLADAHKPITLCALCRAIGWSGTSTGQMQLYVGTLLAHGLVSYEDFKIGTIRPAVRFIPARELP